jgi:hypothetical protein
VTHQSLDAKLPALAVATAVAAAMQAKHRHYSAAQLVRYVVECVGVNCTRTGADAADAAVFASGDGSGQCFSEYGRVLDAMLEKGDDLRAMEVRKKKGMRRKKKEERRTQRGTKRESAPAYPHSHSHSHSHSH